MPSTPLPNRHPLRMSRQLGQVLLLVALVAASPSALARGTHTGRCILGREPVTQGLKACARSLRGLCRAVFHCAPATPVPAGAAGQPVNRVEKYSRYLNNVVVHILGGHPPAVASIAANLGKLPSWAAPMLKPLNVVNSVTGWASIVLDTRETIFCLRNPKATRKDKIMDVVHLLAADVLSTAASMVPLLMPLTNPFAAGFFVGGQVLGMALDVVKTRYDAKRNGQQSAIWGRKAPKPTHATAQ